VLVVAFRLRYFGSRRTKPKKLIKLIKA
jgi:hypothetical protein